MQQPPEVSPELAHLELSKRLDSIERRLDRIETNQREDNAQLRQDMNQANTQLRQEIVETNRRIDRLTRWLIGIQLTTLIALGTLILTRLPG